MRRLFTMKGATRIFSPMGKHSIYLPPSLETLLASGRPAGKQVSRLASFAFDVLEVATPCLTITDWIRCLRASEQGDHDLAVEDVRLILGDGRSLVELLCVSLVCWRYWMQTVTPGENLSARLLAAGARIST